MQVLEEEEESDALRKINHVIVMQPLKPGKLCNDIQIIR